MKRIVYVQGTYVEFTRYCREKQVNPHKQVFIHSLQDIRGLCLCEDCCEIVWGTTGPPLDQEIMETIVQYIAMGHFGG